LEILFECVEHLVESPPRNFQALGPFSSVDALSLSLDVE